jgi:hypothetical protein
MAPAEKAAFEKYEWEFVKQDYICSKPIGKGRDRLIFIDGSQLTHKAYSQDWENWKAGNPKTELIKWQEDLLQLFAIPLNAATTVHYFVHFAQL